MFALAGAQPEGLGAGLDDVGLEGDPVHDRGAEPRVGEGARPFGERGVRRDRDRGAFLAFGEHLEQQFGTAAVELQVAQFVKTQQVDPAVAGDGAGEVLVVGGFDEFVDQRGGGDVTDPIASLGRGDPESSFLSGPVFLDAMADVGLQASQTSLARAASAREPRAYVWSAANHLEGAEAALKQRLVRWRGSIKYIAPVTAGDTVLKYKYVLCLLATCYRYLGEQELATRAFDEALAAGSQVLGT